MPETPSQSFRVGRGIADVTGEPSDCGMLGYGKAEQVADGIHLRQRSRAFVFEASPDECVLLVVAEIPLVFDSIHRAVLARLAATYGDRYTARNVMITCTHTHCGPGGYAHHRIYNMTTGGFRPLTFAAIVDGIVESVERAHADLAPTAVTLGHGEVRDASSNRSPSSFARNPADDRAVFPHGIDPQSTQLTLTRAGEVVGAVNWFATHGTSMTNENTLISSDNKGYAAYHWERLVEGVDYLDGSPPDFIGAFAQTNAGDMSPNLNNRPGSGPTEDEVENTRIIGQRQYDVAAKLAGSTIDAGEGVDARLVHVNLNRMEVGAEFTGDGRPHRTGGPVAGAAALAGTDEGKGFGLFKQGDHNRVVSALSRRLYRWSPELLDAHGPKALAVPAGPLNKLTPMIAEVYPVQLIRLGSLYLIGIPGEVTIVAGLRLRRTVAAIVGADLANVLVAGYSNGYFHYVTTPEEYDEQRYEGGSTFFGRWQLGALMQTVAHLATAMRDGRSVDPGPAPTTPPLRARRSRVRADEPLADRAFGEVIVEPAAAYRRGDRVTATIVSGNLNNDLRRGATYLEVERAQGVDWIRIADDGDWATRLRRRKHPGRATTVTITWDVPADIDAGDYRIRFHGCTRDEAGGLSDFTATTATFRIG